MQRTHSLKLEEKRIVDESQKFIKVNIDSPYCSEVQKESPEVCEKLLTIQSSKGLNELTKKLVKSLIECVFSGRNNCRPQSRKHTKATKYVVWHH